MRKFANKSWYRWLILVAFTVSSFCVSFCQFQPSFFATDLMVDFGLDTQQFQLIVSSSMIAGIFISLFAGTCGDRFGLYKTMIVGCLVSVIGGFMRYFAWDYPMLVISMMVLGFVGSVQTANLAKLAAAWFPPRQAGVAVGIGLAIGMSGIAAAQALTGVLFPDYRSAFLGGAILMVVIAILWIVVGCDKAFTPNDSEHNSIMSGIKEVLPCKNVWFAGIIALIYTGFNLVLSSFLTTGLITCYNVDPVIAGVIASLTTVGSIFGAAFGPGIVTHMRGTKAICIFLPIVSALLILAGWFIDNNIVRGVLFVCAGLFYGMINPLAVMFPAVLPEVEPQHVGTAGGLVSTLLMSGSYIVPSLIVTPLAGGDYNLMIVIDCIVLMVIAVFFMLLPSLHQGKTEKKITEEAFE